MPLTPPRSTLFPYTTLFRSASIPPSPCWPNRHLSAASQPSRHRPAKVAAAVAVAAAVDAPGAAARSEEHTSELQSRENLVCRLLLEKKNRINLDKRSILDIE